MGFLHCTKIHKPKVRILFKLFPNHKTLECSVSFDFTVVYLGFRRWGGGMGGVLFYIGEIKNLAFFETRKVPKIFRKSMKNFEYKNRKIFTVYL